MPDCVLITGASRGIGRAMALAFAASKYRVAIGYNNSSDEALGLIAHFASDGVMAAAVRGDVAKHDDAARMLKEAEEKLGPVSVLINNAGVACDAPFTDVDPDMWAMVFGVNSTGAYNMISAALPGMIRRQSGCIINVSSVWGVYGGSCEVAYSASKAALIGLTKALSRELGPSGIRVNCIAPGVIDTDMNARLDETALCALRDATPLGRIGKPEDIAAAALFLASPAAAFITGQVLGVDGGFVG